MSNDAWTSKDGSLISKYTHRLVSPVELFTRYPKAYFNHLGELIYDKHNNHFILPSMLQYLGEWHSSFMDELYVRK